MLWLDPCPFLLVTRLPSWQPGLVSLSWLRLHGPGPSPTRIYRSFSGVAAGTAWAWPSRHSATKPCMRTKCRLRLPHRWIHLEGCALVGSTGGPQFAGQVTAAAVDLAFFWPEYYGGARCLLFALALVVYLLFAPRPKRPGRSQPQTGLRAGHCQ